MQKLHEQNAQEIANNQILKLANENKLLESKLVIAETVRDDAVELAALSDAARNQAANIMEIMKKENEVAVSNSDYERLKADTHEKRADFNGKVAGWLLAVNVSLCAWILIYLGG